MENPGVEGRDPDVSDGGRGESSAERDVSVEGELRRALEADTTRLGDVYRRAEMNPAAVAADLDVPSVGFVYGYRAAIDAILTGRFAGGATMAAQIASRLRVWLRRSDWSGETRKHLESTLAVVESVANDPGQRNAEDAAAAARTEEVERSGEPGVYVYSLPHYLRYPYDGDSGHTLFKVGRSEIDVFGRLANQARTTALPEDPVLLRVYSGRGVNYTEEEREFHQWLSAADHQRSRGSRSGREWFLTSLRFLDRIAQARGLSVNALNTEALGED